MRLEQLIRRGRQAGVFRTDLPIGWLVSAAHHLLHGAAEDQRAGRFEGVDVTYVVTASVQRFLAVPAPPPG